jgi:hypothetical protein
MGSNTQTTMIKAGASPNVTRSAKESYSMPNLDVVWVALAILPSRKSKTPPMMMAKEASKNLMEKTERMA